jgi:DNA-binding NarL/FixJ family response regulator
VNSEAVAFKTISVLLVDDQRNVRQGLRMRLELEPDIAVVGEAEDGPSAVQALCECEPSVVLLDYELPGMNGLEVVQVLRAAGCDCPVVMLTIHDSAALRGAASRAGCCAFVAKHEPSEALLAAIREACSQP